MNKQARWSESGLTLIQLLMGIAATSVVVWIAGGMVHKANQTKRWIDMQDGVDSVFDTVSSLTDNSLSLMREDWFSERESYYAMDGDFLGRKRIKGSAEPQKSLLRFYTDKQKTQYIDFRRGSYTLDIQKKGNSFNSVFVARRLLLSRCVPLDQINEEFTYSSVAALNYYPVFFQRGGKPAVRCCQMGRYTNSEPVCSGSSRSYRSYRSRRSSRVRENTDKANWPWRVRIFELNASGVKVYPKSADMKNVAGAGFMAYFDKQTDGKLFYITPFVIKNICQSYRDVGKKSPVTCPTKSQLSVTTHVKEMMDSVFDTGQIEVLR